MSNTEIKKGDTWVNRLDETNTVTIANVGAFYITGSSTKDGSYVGSRDDFLHYFKPQPKESVPISDPVNNPSHYTSGSIECIDAIKEALTEEEYRGYCKGNVMKYTWRERHKGGTESLRKAEWYLKQLVGEEECEIGYVREADAEEICQQQNSQDTELKKTDYKSGTIE